MDVADVERQCERSLTLMVNYFSPLHEFTPYVVQILIRVLSVFPRCVLRYANALFGRLKFALEHENGTLNSACILRFETDNFTRLLKLEIVLGLQNSTSGLKLSTRNEKIEHGVRI